MDTKQHDAEAATPSTAMLRTREAPGQTTLDMFERKAEALRKASNVSHFAIAPAALAVLAPLFNLEVLWEDLLVGAAWTTAIALFGIAAHALVQAKRMNV